MRADRTPQTLDRNKKIRASTPEPTPSNALLPSPLSLSLFLSSSDENDYQPKYRLLVSTPLVPNSVSPARAKQSRSLLRPLHWPSSSRHVIAPPPTHPRPRRRSIAVPHPRCPRRPIAVPHHPPRLRRRPLLGPPADAPHRRRRAGDGVVPRADAPPRRPRQPAHDPAGRVRRVAGAGARPLDPRGAATDR